MKYKVLIAYNYHRHGGGSDAVADRTVELLKKRGHKVQTFIRSSKELIDLKGKIRAFSSSLYPRKTIREFENLLDSFEPDVVNVHEIYPLISPWIFKKIKERNIRLVMTCHDYRLSCPVATHFRDGKVCFDCVNGKEINCIINNCADNLFKSITYSSRNMIADRFNLFNDYVDLFVTPSNSAIDILKETTGIEDTRFYSVGNPVPKLNISDDEYKHGEYIAYAGRFGKEKGFDFLVDVVEDLNLPLHVAGDQTEYLKNTRVVPNNVKFTGFLNKKEITGFYKNARVLVVPSLWHETFGLVVAEALQCGTPVIVSNYGALSEVAGPGGLVFEAGNKLSLKNAILNLWNDERKCKEMASKGRQHILKYSDDIYIEKLLSAFKGSS